MKGRIFVAVLVLLATPVEAAERRRGVPAVAYAPPTAAQEQPEPRLSENIRKTTKPRTMAGLSH